MNEHKFQNLCKKNCIDQNLKYCVTRDDFLKTNFKPGTCCSENPNSSVAKYC